MSSNTWNEMGIKLTVFFMLQELLDDPFYVGIREKRVRGEEYYELIDETIQALRDRYDMVLCVAYGNGRVWYGKV